MDELCPGLGLKREDQDWAIIVADPDRIEEFMQYFVDHPGLSRLAGSMLFELVLASINEAMERGDDLRDKLDICSAFITTEAKHYPDEVAYWRGRENDAERWPVSALLPPAQIR